MSSKLAKAHLIVGVVGMLVFVLTGQYMSLLHDGLVGMDDGRRMLMRTAHIFIMLTALINICVGAYAQHSQSGWLRCVISAIILVSPMLMTLEFFYGADDVNIRRPFAYYSLILLFVAGELLVIENIFKYFQK